MKNITLKYYKGKGSKCFNRTKRNNKQNAIVDTHLHMRPFGGPPIEFKKMIDILNKNGILFAVIKGIGQRLPTGHTCTYYKNCPGVNIRPSITNDIINAQMVVDNNLHKTNTSGVKVVLSMTFLNLSKPDEVVDGIYFLDKEYPGLFKWAGEVNVVKQALFKNGHKPVPVRDISKWGVFMNILKKRKIPMTIHLDLGNNINNLKYLPLLEHILKLYPKNKIVLSHLGLSKELTNINPVEHTKVLNDLLSKYKNIYFDISWDVLYKQEHNFFNSKRFYVDLMNKHPTRFLTGTDFVSHISKTKKTYKKELKETSFILKYLNNYAYRRIALGQNYLDMIHTTYKAPKIC